MASSIPGELRQRVEQRARGRCEYCLLPQELSEFGFQLDHIDARKHGGLTVAENLAWSCEHCNGYKGTDIRARDPRSRRVVRPFNPRTDDWHSHFRYEEGQILGLTAIGRATAALLKFNLTHRVHLRLTLQALGHTWNP